MQFNPSAMPKTLAPDAIYMGLENSIEAIQSKNPPELAILLKTRRNRKHIKNLAEDYFSHFSSRMIGEAFQNNLVKMNSNNELLILIFSHMLIPLAEVMRYTDMRNKGTADFIGEFSALDFEAITLNSMYCKFEPDSPTHGATIQKLTDELVVELKHAEKQFKVTIEQMAICFAEAFNKVHPTIQQNFMRSFCQAVAIIGRNHLEDGIEIKSAPLLKAVSAISCTEKRCFPYI